MKSLRGFLFLMRKERYRRKARQLLAKGGFKRSLSDLELGAILPQSPPLDDSSKQNLLRVTSPEVNVEGLESSPNSPDVKSPDQSQNHLNVFKPSGPSLKRFLTAVKEEEGLSQSAESSSQKSNKKKAAPDNSSITEELS